MSTVKLGCPKCLGMGITGNVVESICTQCKGTGMISANDSDSLATINTASTTPLIVTTPKAISAAAVKISSKGK